MTWRPRPTWEQFKRAWQLGLGSAILAWGVIVTSERAPTAVPWVLMTGVGLLGLTISVPWEQKRKDDDTG